MNHQQTLYEASFLEALIDQNIKTASPEKMARLMDAIFNDRLERQILSISALIVKNKISAFKNLKSTAPGQAEIKQRIKDTWKKSETRDRLVDLSGGVQKSNELRSRYIKEIMMISPIEFVEDEFVYGGIPDENLDDETPPAINNDNNAGKKSGKKYKSGRKANELREGDEGYCAKGDKKCIYQRYINKFGKKALSGLGIGITGAAIEHGGLLGGVTKLALGAYALHREASNAFDNHGIEVEEEKTTVSAKEGEKITAPAPAKNKSWWDKVKEFAANQKEDFNKAREMTRSSYDTQNVISNNATSESLVPTAPVEKQTKNSPVQPSVFAANNERQQIASQKEANQVNQVKPTPVDEQPKVVSPATIMQKVNGYTKKNGTPVAGYERVKPVIKKESSLSQSLSVKPTPVDEVNNIESKAAANTLEHREENILKKIEHVENGEHSNTGSLLSKAESTLEESADKGKIIHLLEKIEENTRNNKDKPKKSDKKDKKEGILSLKDMLELGLVNAMEKSGLGKLSKVLGKSKALGIGKNILVGGASAIGAGTMWKGAKKLSSKGLEGIKQFAIDGYNGNKKFGSRVLNGAKNVSKSILGKGTNILNSARGLAGAASGVGGLAGLALPALSVSAAGATGWMVGKGINSLVGQGEGGWYDHATDKVGDFITGGHVARSNPDSAISQKEIAAYRKAKGIPAPKIAPLDAVKPAPVSVNAAKPESAKTNVSATTASKSPSEIAIAQSSKNATPAEIKASSKRTEATVAKPVPTPLGAQRAAMSDGSKYVKNVTGGGNTTIIQQAAPAAAHTKESQPTSTSQPKSSDSSLIRYLDRRANFAPNGLF